MFHTVTFENKYQSWPRKQGLKRGRVLWASFQHCSCVTSPEAGVSVPGSSLNISHCHCSWALSKRKGTIINCAVPHRPTSLYPLSSSSSTFLSLSLYSHPHSFILPTSGSQSPSLSVLPPPPFFPVEAVMGLKDVCDVIQTDCSCVSGMPLPQLLPAAPHPPPPTSILQSLFSLLCAVVCLWLCCA